MGQTVTWLSCALSGALTRSVVHFFPSAGGVSAPYPARCKLTLFGNGGEPRSVVLEGARLSHPDGLWLDDAFPQMREGAGMYGLRVELETAQPRVDMDASGCVIEFHSSLHLTRFWPVKLSKDGAAQRRGALPLIQDPFQVSSIVVVNGGAEAIRPTVRATSLQRTGQVAIDALPLPAIPAMSVAEVPIPQTFFDDVAPQECSFGLLRMAGAELAELPGDAVVFVVYRDPSTTNPVSVCSL
ncbi:MAG: hypothetical protein EBZ48_04125 [Proteobacteria bacterium]|nr:hypothetical protein [Pseudomonadota bacterium]